MGNRSASKLTFSIAFCGIISALSVIIMFISLIPSLAYAVPAVAGIFIWIVSEQLGNKWGYLSFAAVTILSFMLVPELEANFFLLSFFGYYPTLRAAIMKIKNPVIRYAVKLGIFNAAIVLTYNILCVLLSTDKMLEGLEDFGVYAVYILWASGNIAFILYDIFLNSICEIYIRFLKPKLNKLIKAAPHN